MKTKHTPAPWEIVEARDSLQIVTIDRKTDEPDGIIATVKRLAWCNRDMENANARLIAAAPELLAALQAIIKCPGIEYTARIHIERAKTVIARAMGEAEP